MFEISLIELDYNLSEQGNNPTIVIFLDLKGSFESVDHCSTTQFIKKFSPKLTRSYLTNRLATIFNQNYSEDLPSLKYTPNIILS